MIRLLPIAIVLLAVLLVLLARNASRKKGEALFATAGLAAAPHGPAISLQGQKRPTRVVDGVLISVGIAKTRTRNPETLVGSHRPHEGPGNTIEKVKTITTAHLWIVYPQPYPFPFSFAAGPGQQPVFEGNYDDMSTLLSTENVAIAAQTLLATLAPLQGDLWLDNTMLDVSLPEGEEISPLMLSQALDLWRAVRDGSDYPYRAGEDE